MSSTLTGSIHVFSFLVLRAMKTHLNSVAPPYKEHCVFPSSFRMDTPKKVIAFDIGIKNLAYAVVEQEQEQEQSQPHRLTAWENINLLAEDTSPSQGCSAPRCRSKASFRVMDRLVCKRHVPKTHTFLPGWTAKKRPLLKALRDAVRERCPASPLLSTLSHATVEQCIEALAPTVAIPYAPPKAVNASKVSLEKVHDALRHAMDVRWHLFSGATEVLLENQPAFKNPHMKSVQVLLFATLREWFLRHGECPAFHLVHAKKKVADAPKGDAGYQERKDKSEQRVEQLFVSDVHGPTFYQEWKKAKKKSDMADALCMAVDFLSV